ncbi:carbohydrate esterase family 4 protein [Hygrophoropsis aurantiaca]|uniref:Carbohydrate esterase family 4 protein n=1 Tax=Hygrophoropsis aurantiaca TaxID=72124 RepID=A0ACB7ZXN2_9AGAM|nr:carbohydrate esterase family 4 protein [Hygrophoropsis aurantiaca]
MSSPSFFNPKPLFASALFTLSILSVSVNAQDRTTEQGEAQITDPSLECSPYSYAPVSNALSSFPAMYQPATIVASDYAAQEKYQSMIGQIPNIAPKGTQPASLMGDFSGLSYPNSDPDCWWTDTKCTTPKLAGLSPDITSLPEPDTLGYGFDDGPSCSHNAFYDYLQENNQKATMFYIGSNVMSSPLEAQRALADGHEVCVHTWSHRYMTSLTNEQVFAEFYYSEDLQAIKLVVGVTPTCWRPPFGDVDDRVRAFANAFGLRTIVWQYDSNDWREGTGGYTAANVDSNYEALIAMAQNGTYSTAGTTMLTHELNNFTMSEAVKFLDQLKSAFKYLVPIGVALNQTQPYVETNYSLPSFAQYISGTTTVSGGSGASSTSSSSSATASSSGAGQSSSTGSGSGSGQKTTGGSIGVPSAFIGAGALTAAVILASSAMKFLAF